MVLVLDGPADLGAHERSNLRYLKRLRHLIKSRAVTMFVLSKNTYFPSSVRNNLPSNISSMPGRKNLGTNSVSMKRKGEENIDPSIFQI